MVVRDLTEHVSGREIGLAVLDVREAARLNQVQLAEIIKVSKQTISNIERGYSGTNDLARLKRIARECAGRGWLPDDEDSIRRYILGEILTLPVVMKRPNLSSLVEANDEAVLPDLTVRGASFTDRHPLPTVSNGSLTDRLVA